METNACSAGAAGIANASQIFGRGEAWSPEHMRLALQVPIATAAFHANRSIYHRFCALQRCKILNVEELTGLVALRRGRRIIAAAFLAVSACRFYAGSETACGLGVRPASLWMVFAEAIMADGNQQEFPTVLGPDANFKGKLNFEKGMRLMGRFEGKMNTPGRLHVA